MLGCLHKEGSGVGGLVTPVTGDALGELVVASEAMDTGLDENQTELGVLEANNQTP